MIWNDYPGLPGGYDGYLDAAAGRRPACAPLMSELEALGIEGITHLQRSAELSLLNQGITFTVYSDDRGTERILPFDVLPRLVTAGEWARLERGIEQRIQAVNVFLRDLYGDQKILKDGVVPSELALGSMHFCREMMGAEVPGGVFVHVSGTDIVQDETGCYRVLEDNLRVPSGVSYVLENRLVMSRILPEALQRYRVRRVDHYPQLLLDGLRALSPRDTPTIAVLTPGIYNSAYFEHSFLASQMGVELVEGNDLVVDQDVLYMKTTDGPKRVDVLYRRIDDAFLDPLCFRPDSLLGVPGLMRTYRAGNVALANAPGTGVVDDKAMYAYLPRVIRYYLGEEPVLDQVPTYLCREPADRAFVLEHLEELVLKPTDGSGGYGLVVGRDASREVLARARDAIRAEPHRFVAQPTLSLSTLPTGIDSSLPPSSETRGGARIAPRHVDLRPFAVCSPHDRVRVLPGGLTRVALREGSLVVNSSQGGGSKDTWVLHPELHPEEPEERGRP